MTDKTKAKLRKIKYKIYIVKLVKRSLEIKRSVIRKYPLTIQLPITYLCNFDCKMCGMHHMINRKDFSSEQLGIILSDKLFSKVEAVGINGGEPFLKHDLVDCVKQMVTNLPNLKEFHIISNGYFTETILTKLKEIKQIAEENSIKVNLAISIDGIDDMQDFHRGRVNAFKNANETIEMIQDNYSVYVDYMNVICTITKYNIYRINEVEAWAENHNIDVAYNLATENVRIENEDRVDDFSVFSDDVARSLAEEFFYKKYLETDSEKYFGLYLYLNEKCRYAECPCMQNEWITLTPDTQIGFCATHSKNLGSALEQSSYEIVQKNIGYLKEIRCKYCNGCSHYMYRLSAKGLIRLYKDKMRRTM